MMNLLTSPRADRPLKALIMIPPTECDAGMRRDGIAPRPSGGSFQLDDRTHLMLEVMARTPLRIWTNEFGRSAEQVLAVPSGGWAPVLFTGWSRAAMAQRDQEWMAALINLALADGPPGRPHGAETLRHRRGDFRGHQRPGPGRALRRRRAAPRRHSRRDHRRRRPGSAL